MPKQEITQEELRDILQEMSIKWGSQTAVADHLGISNAYISDILRGARQISNQVAQKLGYKRIVKYKQEKG